MFQVNYTIAIVLFNINILFDQKNIYFYNRIYFNRSSLVFIVKKFNETFCIFLNDSTSGFQLFFTASQIWDTL